MADYLGDAIASAVLDAIWFTLADDYPHVIAHAFPCSDPECDRGPDRHTHILPSAVADAVARG